MAQGAQEEQLLDIRIAEASTAYKFYLNNEKLILGTTAVIVFMLTWETIGNWAGLINPMFMSAPSMVGKAAWQLFSSGEIYNDLYISGIEFFWGYFLSVIFAVPFGIAIGWYKRFAYVCDPFVNAMNATPRVALLPLVIIWLGIGILSKVGIIFLGAVFPLLINTRDGVKTTPANLAHRGAELRRFRMADFQSGRAPFHRAVHFDRSASGGRPRAHRRHGRRALCRHRWHRFHDHGRRRHVPNR